MGDGGWKSCVIMMLLLLLRLLLLYLVWMNDLRRAGPRQRDGLALLQTPQQRPLNKTENR